MPRQFSRDSEKLLAKLAESGAIAENERPTLPSHVSFSHFDFPELKDEKIGDEVLVVMRGYVTETNGAKIEKGGFGERFTTGVRFSKVSVVHGNLHGSRRTISDMMDKKP